MIVCGRHDEAKREFLSKQGMSVASEWYISQNTDNDGPQT